MFPVKPSVYVNYSKYLLNQIRYNPETTLLYHGTSQFDKNWGDLLNIYLLPLLSGKNKALLVRPPTKNSRADVAYRIVRKTFPKSFENIDNTVIYSAVGSVLGWLYAENSVVWGSGFLHEGNKLPVEPKEILAVRGPRTAEVINEQYGISVDVFGDPAVLYTRYYWPTVAKKYPLGIIPHYVDYDTVNKMYQDRNDVCVIDIKSGNKEVIDALLSCQTIASSSLHGLIMADAYGIPTTWIDWITPKIDDFKYYDYYESIRCEKELVSLNSCSDVSDIISLAERPQHLINMKKLLEVCPFYNKEVSPIQI